MLVPNQRHRRPRPDFESWTSWATTSVPSIVAGRAQAPCSHSRIAVTASGLGERVAGDQTRWRVETSPAGDSLAPPRPCRAPGALDGHSPRYTPFKKWETTRRFWSWISPQGGAGLSLVWAWTRAPLRSSTRVHPFRLSHPPPSCRTYTPPSDPRLTALGGVSPQLPDGRRGLPLWIRGRVTHPRFDAVPHFTWLILSYPVANAAVTKSVTLRLSLQYPYDYPYDSCVIPTTPVPTIILWYGLIPAHLFLFINRLWRLPHSPFLPPA